MHIARTVAAALAAAAVILGAVPSASGAARVAASGEGDWRLERDAGGIDLTQFDRKWSASARNFSSIDCWSSTPFYVPSNGFELGVGPDPDRPATLATGDVLYANPPENMAFALEYRPQVGDLSISVGAGAPLAAAVPPTFNAIVVQVQENGIDTLILDGITLDVPGEGEIPIDARLSGNDWIVIAPVENQIDLGAQPWVLGGDLTSTFADCDAAPGETPLRDELRITVWGVFAPFGDLRVRVLNAETGAAPLDAGGAPAQPTVSLSSGETKAADASGVAEFIGLIAGPRRVRASAPDYADGVALGVVPRDRTGDATALLTPRAPGVYAVTGEYMEGSKPTDPVKTFYLDRVTLDETFTAFVDWGVNTPDRVEFRTFNGQTFQGARVDGSDAKWSVDTEIDASFDATSAIDGLEVVAISAAANESDPFTPPMRVVPRPQPFDSDPPDLPRLVALSFGDTVKYVTPVTLKIPFAYTLIFPEGASLQVDPDSPPLFGEDAAWSPEFELKPEINLDGSGSLGSVSVGLFDKELDKATARNAKGNKYTVANVTFAGGVSASLKYQFDLDAERWKHPGELGGAVSGSIGLPPEPFPFLVGPVPFYIQTTIGLAFNAALTIDDLTSGGLPEWASTVIKAEPSLTGTLGVGASRGIAVEGSVTGKLATEWTYDAQNPEGALTGDKAALVFQSKIKAFIVEFSSPELEFAYPVVPDGGGGSLLAGPGPSSHALAAPAELTIAVPDRAYLSDPAGVNTPADRPTPDRADGATAEDVLLNVLPEAGPAAASLGDDVLIVASLDDPTRSALNRAELSFLVYDDDANAWSAPAPVADDGTADLSPALETLSTGEIIAVWHDAAAVLPDLGPNPSEPAIEAAFDSYKQSSEIAAALFDPATRLWSPPVRLTSDALLDYGPVIAAGPGGTAVAAWITNDAGEEIPTPAAPNRVRYATFDGTAWSPPADAFDAPGLERLDLWTDGQESIIFFSADTDGDFATALDRELFVASRTTGAWSAPTRLTSNSDWDSGPKIETGPLGAPIFIYTSGAALFTATDRAALADERLIVAPNAAAAGLNDLTTAADDDGSLAVAFQRTTGSGQDLALLTYDAPTDAWSVARSLTEDADLDVPGAPAFGAAGELLLPTLRSLIVPVDRSNVEIDGEFFDLGALPTRGRTDLRLLRRASPDDPALAAGSAELVPPNPAPGEGATLTLDAVNRGDRPAEFAIALFAGDPNASAPEIARVAVGPLAPGAALPVAIDFAVDADAPPVDLFVVADPDSAVPDDDRGNNTVALASFRSPDLSIPLATARNVGPNDQLIELLVENNGGAAITAPIEIEVADAATDALIATLSVPGPLLPSANATAQFLWANPSLPAAGVELRAAADPADSISESEEANNAAFFAALPLLQPPSPAAACAGDVDGNGATDIGDFFALAGNFGAARDPDDRAAPLPGDLDSDGAVDVTDFFILAADLGCRPQTR